MFVILLQFTEQKIIEISGVISGQWNQVRILYT